VPPPDQLVDELAGAILDGAPIDWAVVESSADGDARVLVRQLKVLAAVADVHRDGPPAIATLSWEPSAVPEAASDVTLKWGHLRLFELVGRGAFGQVYRAWDTRLDREVALKLLPAARTSDRHPASSIIHEGRLLARVRHANVVTIYGAEQIGDQVGLWMEFVRGQTLEQLLKQGTVFSADDAVLIGLELGRAVSAVHSAGVLHRDIKAHNVTRAWDGRIVLMDLGTGRELDDSSSSDLTGTPLYLAPEVLRGGSATVQSDIYSLGVLLYHLVTGSYPVSARTMPAIRLAHERGDRISLSAARPDLPSAFVRVIERAMDPRPEQRYQTADALVNDLQALSAHGDPARTRASARWKWLGLGAAALVLSLAASDSPASVRARPALGARASVLVGAFTGSADDRDLVATVQQAVTSELEQSSFLNVYPPSRVREALDALKRPAGTTIDEPLGFEICARQGLAALISGSVEARDGRYRVMLRATHASTRAVLASSQVGTPTREEALEAAVVLTRQLRGRLGEPPAAVQATSSPIEPVTSQSFEAQRQFTLGRQLYDVERPLEALPHFLRAIEWDSNFAMAYEYAALTYGYLGEYDRKGQYLDVAARLASDASTPIGQLEREKILADRDVHLERFEDAAAHLRTMLSVRTDGRTLANLGLVYGSLRQYPESIAALEGASRDDPHPRIRWMLADMYSSAGRPEDAARLIGQQLERPFDWIVLAKHLLIGGRQAEARAALSEAERLSRQPSGSSWVDLAMAQADFFRSEGRYRDAEHALQQGLDRSGRAGVDGLARGASGTAERLELAMASLLVDWGRPAEASEHIRRIDVQLARNRIVHGVLAARAGDVVTADAILRRLEQEAVARNARRPDARVHQLRAEIAIANGHAVEAHAFAGRAVGAFQTAWTLETLARAQQAAGRIPEAIETWTTILERPGERTIDFDAPAYSQVVLAQYRLARLLERAGRVDEARARYDDFLRRWERSDPDLPVVVDARERRRRLGQGAQSTPSGRAPKPAA
jgi:tetratricopeptide (TPR) repeat protein